MSSKNITITKKAYDYLKGIKGKRSFSETILSLKHGSDEILQYAGALKNADLNSIKKIRQEANDDWNNRV